MIAEIILYEIGRCLNHVKEMISNFFNMYETGTEYLTLTIYSYEFKYIFQAFYCESGVIQCTSNVFVRLIKLNLNLGKSHN